MKRFEFSLESVLRHRRRIEEERQQALAQLGRQRAEKEKEAERTSQHRDNVIDELEKKQQSEMDVRDILECYSRIYSLERTLRKEIVEIRQLRCNEDKARQDLTTASKDRKLLDRLRERRFDEYRHQAGIEEQKLIDEFGVLRFKPRQD